MPKLEKGKNDFETVCPEGAKEWHPELNEGKLPSDFMPGSGFQAWWKCSKCGHVWKARILHRKDGVGCPICGKKRAVESQRKTLLAKNKSFGEKHPNLLAEWDEKLNSFGPFDISAGSNKKVYWKCPHGHPSYLDTISHRLDGRGCPVCSGHRIIPGINDFASHYPELAKEWHPTLNALTPDKIGLTSSKKIWWLCEKGHSYQSLVQSRIQGQSCPFCSNHQVLVGFNDLESVNPELAKEWHPTKNKTITPSMIIARSHKKRWWLCPRCGHEWETSPKVRMEGSGCPKCASEKQTSFPEQAILFYLSQVTEAKGRFKLDGSEIDIYLPLLNAGIEYDGIWFHSTEKAVSREVRKNQKLKQAGVRLLRIKEIDKGTSHPYGSFFYYRYAPQYRNIGEAIQFICSSLGIACDIDINVKRDQFEINAGYLTSQKKNSLLSKKPELRNEWDYQKNGSINPDSIAYTSGKEVWWICPEGHSYKADAQHRYRGNGCPFCSGHRVLAGFNDLGTTDPSIAKLWDHEKNSFGPETVSRGSEKRVFWKCDKGHSWEATVIQLVRTPKCPICSGKKMLVGFNDLATVDPALAKEWDKERNGELGPQDVMISYSKKVWWVCPKGHHYKALIYNRAKGQRTGCPICAGKKKKDG